MSKVLISDSMSNVAQKIFEKNNISVDVKTGLSEEEIIKIIPEYNGMVVRSATKVTKKIIEAAKNLKVIGRAGAGVDNIDISSAKEKNMIVMNTPGGNANATAEHAFAKGVLLSTDIINANACSAVALAFPPGVFITIIFFSFALDISILSTPAPALPITFKFFAASIIFLVTFVADLTTIPLYSGIILIISSSDRPVLTSTEILFFSKIF
jgi:D-3-phosphoglycerate dehydrogenase